jgi:hypothetical protein
MVNEYEGHTKSQITHLETKDTKLKNRYTFILSFFEPKIRHQRSFVFVQSWSRTPVTWYTCSSTRTTRKPTAITGVTRTGDVQASRLCLLPVSANRRMWQHHTLKRDLADVPRTGATRNATTFSQMLVVQTATRRRWAAAQRRGCGIFYGQIGNEADLLRVILFSCVHHCHVIYRVIEKSINFQKFILQVLLNIWRRYIYRLKGELSKLFSHLTSTRCEPHV